MLFTALLLGCTVFGIYKSIFYGCDIDESYAITLSYRLAWGDHLFKEMWEVHQTSAIFMAPFIYAYRLIHGTTLGMVVYLRIVGTLIQLVVAVFLYHSTANYISSKYALILTVLFFDFSPKYSQVLEFCFLEYLFLTCMAIAFLYYFDGQKKCFLVIAGVFQAFSVFAYPQMIVILPFELLLLLYTLREDEKKWLGILCFFGAEGVTGLTYLLYILCHVSIKEFMENIPYILSDGSHQLNLTEKIVNHGREILGYLIPLFVGILLFEITMTLLRKAGREEKRFIPECGFLTAGLLYALVPVIQKYYTGIRHLDLSYGIIFLSEVLAYLNLRFGKRDRESRRFLGIMLILFMLFLCSCFASNMTIYANGGLLVPVMLLLWISFIRNHDFLSRPEMRTKKEGAWAIWFPITLLCAYFLLARMTLVRFTAVQPKTIFNTYYTIKAGTAENIKVTEQEHIRYHDQLAAISTYVTAADSMLFFGSDTYCYFLTGCGIATPTTISTPMYDETILEYYKKYPYKQPTVIIVDKYWQGLDQLLAVPQFGDWVRENYDLEHMIEEAYTIVIFKNA